MRKKGPVTANICQLVTFCDAIPALFDVMAVSCHHFCKVAQKIVILLEGALQLLERGRRYLIYVISGFFVRKPLNDVFAKKVN